MKLTVIGCSGSVPGPESAASSYLLEHDGFRVVVDLGHGAFGALQRHLKVDEIDAVVISHLHADHWIDLTALDVARAYGPFDVFGLLPVYGPAATAERFAGASGGAASAVARSTFDFRELRLATTIGPFTVRTARMAHPGEAFATRFEVAGQSLVYSGDTGPCEALGELADGVDVLLAEASAVEGDPNPPDLHLTGLQLGEVAAAAGVGHLVITHVQPWNSPEVALAESRTRFDGTTSLAAPGWSLELGR